MISMDLESMLCDQTCRNTPRTSVILWLKYENISGCRKEIFANNPENVFICACLHMKITVFGAPIINPAVSKKVFTHACMQKHNNGSMNL